MKKLLCLFVALATIVNAQGWQPAPGPNASGAVWPDSLQKTQKVASGIHGIAVTPDGKVWIAPWNTSPNVNDTVINQQGNKVKAIPILVYNQDGSLHQRILKCTIKDTIYPFTANWRGLGLDKDGNVLASAGSRLIKLDYTTYDTKVNELFAGPTNLLQSCGAENGNIYLGYVLGKYPVTVLNPDLTFSENAVNALPGIGRAMAVSKDGNTIYLPRYTLNHMYIYERPDEFSPFALKDSVLLGMKCEAMRWDPRNENWLWLSIGSYNDVPDSPFVGYQGVYLCYDVRTWEKVDSLKWQFQSQTPETDKDERNRGIDFYLDRTNNKLYAYIGCFGGSKYAPVLRFVKDVNVSVKDEIANPKGYKLEQNYPNPFNPETHIVYSLPEAGHVTIKVYDMLGKEIATLVNEYKQQGSYYVRFEASKLAAGAYVYRMTVNNVTLTKKMMLIK